MALRIHHHLSVVLLQRPVDGRSATARKLVDERPDVIHLARAPSSGNVRFGVACERRIVWD
jgi:hypothetical protein